MMPSRALVIGGRGLIGGTLVGTFRAEGIEVVYTTRDRQLVATDPCARYLDLLEPPIYLPLRFTSCHCVFLIAGVPGVYQCERDPNAWRVNADAPAMLAYQAAQRQWPIVFLSTGAVEIAPHTAYAMQKARAEAVVLALGGAVVRPRGRIDQINVQAFAQFLIGAAESPGVHWWNE